MGHLFGIYRSFARSVRHFSASVAHQNFNFRLEKCIFPVYEPSWKPSFSIRCSIECILNELFIFSHWFVHHFVKNSSWFCKNYESVLPALGGKHIFEERFLQLSCARPCFHTHTGFKITTFRGAFPPCAVQKMVVFADWAENGSPGMLSFASLLISCMWDRIFERNKHHSMPQWCKRGSLSAFPKSLLQEHHLKLQCTRGHLLPLFTSVSAAFESALFTGRSGRSRIASAKTSVRSSMRSS